jgi:signal transduction histidine kinase
VQELLFNVVKHAQTGTAAVSLHLKDENAVVTVTDQGIGFDPTSVDDNGTDALGLSGLSRRASDLGATFTIESAPGRGTRVSITCPLDLEAGSPEDNDAS